jgi:hypothetical protein
MKKFTTKLNYESSGKKGLVFLSISQKDASIINKRMVKVDQKIAENNSKAVEQAKKIVLNR